jgi:histidinol-phosphate aminotransferase
MPPVLAKPAILKIAPHMLPTARAGLPPVRIALNSNECAFGPSPAALEAARAAVADLRLYPDGGAERLTAALAEAHDLDPARLAVGQGSDDILARLARAYLGPGTALVRSANGYLKVPNYAHANDAEAVSAPDEAFRPVVDNLLAAVTPATRILYLANPENPAGTFLTGREVRRLHAGLPGHVLLVLDAAYQEYIDHPEAEDPRRLVDAADNVVMVRSFSKAHGLAGARVGWLYGPPAVADAVRRLGLTFPLAGPSIAAAVASLGDPGHVAWVAGETRRLRAWLSDRLTALGLAVTASQGNFVLVGFPPDRPAAAAAAALRAGGIDLRRFASPAYDAHLRITIGPEPDLAGMLDALGAWLGRRSGD